MPEISWLPLSNLLVPLILRLAAGICPAEIPMNFGALTIEDHRGVRMLVVLVVVVVVVHGTVVRMGVLPNWRGRLHPEAKAPVEVLREAPHDAHVHADAHGRKSLFQKLQVQVTKLFPF